MNSNTAESAKRKTSSMDSSFPVFLPEESCLRMASAEFEEHALKSLPPTATGDAMLPTKDVAIQDADAPSGPSNNGGEQSATGNPFVDALERTARGESTTATGPAYDLAQQAARNLALTENQGVAFASTQSTLVDLFHHLDGECDDSRADELTPLLENSWAEDPLATLKVIWNSRSIHLGKGERDIFYVALGWLSQHHPRTLLVNLQWLFRGVIEKDAKQRQDDDTTLVEKVASSVDDYEFPNGVSHGYWKDLLNILVLSANDSLDMMDPSKVLLETNTQSEPKVQLGPDNKKQKLYCDLDGVERGNYKKKRSQEDRLDETQEYNQLQKKAAKTRKRDQEAARHAAILEKFSSNPFHRALHLTIARLFAEQLSKDMLLVQTTDPDQHAKGISLCAKWAPSLEGFHDKHTFIATTIAEILFPQDRIGEKDDSREQYLKRARNHYRTFTLSPLRKALRVVERDITAQTFGNINYSRVPSLAMDKYKKLFEEKDGDGFKKYLKKVALGKATISGAVLDPGVLVRQVRGRENSFLGQEVANAQWNTLVQRIKDSGSLSDSMAVCDVSGSMSFRADRNGVIPMDTAMGLSLVLSAVTNPPFGGKVITFSQDPEVLNVGGEDDKRSLKEQVSFLGNSKWGMNTDFLKVFMELILPIAMDNKVKPEDMVKRIFVFSDMQFDSAARFSTDNPWARHHQIIEEKFAGAGYDVPELVYWDLNASGNRPAPVMQDMPGTALVGGRSQALIKVFLDGGSLDQPEEEEEGGGGDDDEFEMVEGMDATDSAEVKKKRKETMTALSAVKKAIGHKAYEMLKVVD